MLSVIQNPPRIALPIAGSTDLFPVRRVYCVGRNYAAHAREMGADPDREPPFFFMKPADALQIVGAEPTPHTYPPQTQNYHFEVELVAALSGGGSDIPTETALDQVYGYAIGLDMTRRDLQDEAKKLSRPWDLGKAADGSGPIGPLFPASAIGHPAKGAITLSVDGAIRQTGDLADMIWSVAEQVAYLSRYFTLQPGDLIFTGTPSGVGPVRRGERMVAAIAGLGEMTLDVV
ncbi:MULTISPECIES: fumarylacetoacetate hydrolase family protein [unclassified Methylobacterium]|uniref:fumarylacetoacetate hydrolase family protein n=1 Tax=unclassified Methylobacterium TaxID=2615210 RepID=UPI0011C1FF98|nr:MULTISPECIES: fumarylacetoacetate hydrolase family protein [unclassified Methylobacterium]QEE42554.1 fumarylacetoacetate hydrolase family protein [Methylobacterium sp. WL1]TXN03710.1 fumarylacetoacetate hydrolase family protein [Methylobacterium sp. WL64]TXN58145.1 fumarylacetoacetate hydrolase family protein [Methylobacterium sp. WL2]